MIVRNIFIIIGFILGLLACTDESFQSDFKPILIVDGRIESGNFPIVYITRNIPYYSSIDSTNISYLVIKQAKVTVSDGTNSEILTLGYDKKRFPPWYYSGNDFMGEPGKTYKLTVEWGATKLESITTIPNLVASDSIWYKPSTQTSDRGTIQLRIKDDEKEENYYKIFTKVAGKDDDFTPTILSDYSDWYFNGLSYTFSLSKGPKSYLSAGTEKDFYYMQSDTVLIKFCTMDKESFAFWKSYRSEAVNGANPFASSFHAVNSNISGGAGIWSGLGVRYYQIITK